MIYTTEKDFELFKKEAKKWIDRLGLFEWEVIYYHEPIGADADCTSFRNAKTIILRLNKKINNRDKTKYCYIKETAQHEVFHVLLENLYHQAVDRAFCDENYGIEEHAIIHRLQKAFKE